MRATEAPVSVVLSTGYKYTSLQHSISEIRLLVLEPGNPSEAVIKCHLKHAILADRPEYEALSYVWGSTIDRRPIHVEGRVTEITKNLEIALRHLRDPKQPRTLWVDALSINQEDLDERCKQVQLMAEIYGQATKVLAWTGADEDEKKSAEALATCEELSNFWYLFPNFETDASLDEIFSPAYFKARGVDIWSWNWTGLLEIFNREYWHRIWIIQELAIPSWRARQRDGPDVVTVGWGSHWISWSTFRQTCMALTMVYGFLTTKLSPEEQCELPIGYRRPQAVSIYQLLKLQTGTLESLLERSASFRAMDSRDRIYALLSLAKDEDRLAIRPDYHKSDRHLRRDVAIYMIQARGNLRCLMGNRRDPRDEAFTRPSWAIDLNKRILAETQNWHETGSFSPSGSSAATAIPLPGDVLNVDGLLIDNIVTIFGPLDFSENASLNLPQIYQGTDTLLQILFKPLDELFSTLEPHRQDELWRTLVMDQDLGQASKIIRPAPDHFKHAYEVLRGRSTVPSDFEPELPLKTQIEMYLDGLTENMSGSLTDRCLFVTQSGKFGVGPGAAKIGDLAVILFGGDWCYVLRGEDDGKHSLLGTAYVHGVMNGEFMRAYEAGGEGAPERRTFSLI